MKLMVSLDEICLILALEKDPGGKLYSHISSKLTSRTKVESPAATSAAPATTTSANAAPTNIASTAAKPPPRPTAPTDKANTAHKVKVVPSKAAGSSFFQKVAQTPTIPKTPVLPKTIPLKKYLHPRKELTLDPLPLQVNPWA